MAKYSRRRKWVFFDNILGGGGKITVELHVDNYPWGQKVEYPIDSNTHMSEMVTAFHQYVTPTEQRWSIRDVELPTSLHGYILISDGRINITNGMTIKLRREPFYPGGGGYGGASGPQDEKYDDADFDSLSTAAGAIEAVFKKFKNNKSYYQAIDCIRFFLPNTTDSKDIARRFRNMMGFVHSESPHLKKIAAHILNDAEFNTFRGQITGCQHNH